MALTELPVPQHDPAQARRAAAEVLAREEYADLRPGLLDRLWSLVLDGIGRLIDLIGQTGRAGLVGSVIFLIALALLVLGAVRLLRRVRPSRQVVEPRVDLRGRSAQDWAAEAAAHERDGHWREAVRCHHRALIAELVAAGMIEDAPGRTAAEHEVETAAAAPAAAEPMRAATRLFERAWYARTPVGDDDVERLHRAATEVRRTTGLRVPAGRR